MSKKFTTRDVGHEHVDVEVILECSKKIHNEGMVYSREDIAFGIYMLDLPEADNLSFAEDFHGEVALCL